ncbi:hypothetical protein CVD28_17995 [Bacillus sp. M6-12]|nr:hypothetical protein CVD28_17995 [Bacillus sp. M6-12]
MPIQCPAGITVKGDPAGQSAEGSRTATRAEINSQGQTDPIKKKAADWKNPNLLPMTKNPQLQVELPVCYVAFYACLQGSGSPNAHPMHLKTNGNLSSVKHILCTYKPHGVAVFA